MKATCTALLFGLGLSTAANAGAVRAVPSVELDRYAGTWHEQAHLPMYFQRKCAGNTRARYTLRADQRIRVENQCEQSDGTLLKSEGVAKTVDGSGAKLKVRFAPAALSFLPFVWGDYWVIGLDPDYQWAVVGTPNRKYLWLLTREQKVGDAHYARMVELARTQGFDVARLRRTPQR